MFIGYLLLTITTFFFYRAVQQTHILDIVLKRNNGLDEWISKQMSISFKTILKNIHPPGTTRGFLAASLSTSHPDYFYTWTRDAALVVRVLCDLPETEDNLLKDYVEFQVDTQNTPTVCQCLGEPKFNPDGSAFSGPWGRPQNDGPAERAITLMKIINRFKGKHDDFIKKTIMTALKKDLDYTARVWEEPCFDLWEEVNGIHFYTLMVMRRALMDGYYFFNNKKYQSTANDIQKRLETFWSPEENYIRVTQDEQSGVNKTSGLDVSVLLAASTFSSIGEGKFFILKIIC
jgi:glucoamylase